MPQLSARQRSALYIATKAAVHAQLMKAKPYRENPTKAAKEARIQALASLADETAAKRK